MRMFIKHIKVLGLAKHEVDAVAEMLREASHAGKAERQMSSTEYLAIEVSDVYDSRQHPAEQGGVGLAEPKKSKPA